MLSLNCIILKILYLLKQELDDLKSIKYVQTLIVTFVKKNHNKEMESYDFIYKIENDITEKQLESQYEILNNDEWLSECSGWEIDSIDKHYININIYQPLKGGTYIDLPFELKHPMKGLINVKNEDDKCFLYCHLYNLHKIEIAKKSTTF